MKTESKHPPLGKGRKNVQTFPLRGSPGGKACLSGGVGGRTASKNPGTSEANYATKRGGLETSKAHPNQGEGKKHRAYGKIQRDKMPKTTLHPE